MLIGILACVEGCTCGTRVSGERPDAICIGLADGTPCSLWWEPCVKDAACSGGACRSATAEAETPGQVRWQVALDAGAVGPLTVDADGNSTFLTGLKVSAISAPIRPASSRSMTTAAS